MPDSLQQLRIIIFRSYSLYRHRCARELNAVSLSRWIHLGAVPERLVLIAAVGDGCAGANRLSGVGGRATWHQEGHERDGCRPHRRPQRNIRLEVVEVGRRDAEGL